MKVFTQGSMKLAIALTLLAIGSVAQADAILTVWNVADIDGTGDQVVVTVGVTSEGQTTLSFQWQEGDTTDALTSATALDQVYFNTLEDIGTWSIVDVLDNGVSDMDNWSFGVGGENSGAGGIFGTFGSRANKEAPADDGGIEPNYFTFVFSGSVTFVPNSDGATYSAHVRYSDSDCSGWVSNPNPEPDAGDINPGTCFPVSEPGTISLLGIGLIGIGFVRRRKILPARLTD